MTKFMCDCRKYSSISMQQQIQFNQYTSEEISEIDAIKVIEY